MTRNLLFAFAAFVATAVFGAEDARAPAIAAPVSTAEGPSQAQRQVTVGVPKSFPPYYQLDEDGNPSGFAVVVMNEVAKRAGLKVTYLVTKSVAAIEQAIRAGLSISSPASASPIIENNISGSRSRWT